MKHLVIYASKSIHSAKKLATAFNTRTNGEWSARVFNPYKKHIEPINGEYAFSYGCGADIYEGHIAKRFNKRKAIKTCINKLHTFRILHSANIPAPCCSSDWSRVPDTWDTIVVRESVTGAKGEGMEYLSQQELATVGYKYSLFTEYFEHKYEYRIVVFMGKIIGRYYKADNAGEWYFNLQRSRGFEEMDAACIKAAAALSIDYVGFDVVANTKKDFKILEANSGPILTDEAEDAILSYFLNMENN